MELYQIDSFSFAYPGAKQKALENISFTVKQGEFIVVCGKSGCGKSTLLRSLKQTLAPYGTTEGNVLFCGKPLSEISQREDAAKIGFVLQNPDNQIVTDKVYHELAFGLESLGVKNSAIRLRVSEMASFFGIQDWFYQNVAELSGGQKQIVSLASVMAMQPDVLILDEPSSQLDPIAAGEFFSVISKINRELGTTVIVSEHRLEDVIPIADRVLVLDRGRLITDCRPNEIGERLFGHEMFCAMPVPIRVYSQVEAGQKCPVNVREGRAWLGNILQGKKVTIKRMPAVHLKENILTIKNVWFKYDKNGVDILKDLNMSVPRECLYAIVGGNGTGKSTALGVISGMRRAYRGKIKICGSYKIGTMPQNPQTMFVKKTVELDLYDVLTNTMQSEEEKKKQIDDVLSLTELKHLVQMHPYDLSGGEQQRAALAKILLLEPDILLLDEPTKGLDAHYKIKFARILKTLISQGKTVIMVSHDIEFCAEYADVCALFFDGSVITQNDAHTFFAGNSFYTTAANRMSRNIIDNCVTEKEVVGNCRANLSK